MHAILHAEVLATARQVKRKARNLQRACDAWPKNRPVRQMIVFSLARCSIDASSSTGSLSDPH
eukprot:4007828-Pleurochrysis_carterae.AAC.14